MVEQNLIPAAENRTGRLDTQEVKLWQQRDRQTGHTLPMATAILVDYDKCVLFVFFPATRMV